MNDIYAQKAKKYKYKYLKLKTQYFGEGEGGGLKSFFGFNKKTSEAEKAREAKKKAHEARLNNDPLYKECFNIYSNSNSVLNSNSNLNSNREDTSYDILFKRREDEIHTNIVNARNGSYGEKNINKYNFWEFYAAKCPTLAQIAEEDKIKADKEAIKKAEQKLQNEAILKEQNKKKDFNNRVERCMNVQKKICEIKVTNEIEQENKPYEAPEKVQLNEEERKRQEASDNRYGQR
jgi:hypothetical protein